VASGDELRALVRSFNETVVALRKREELRGRNVELTDSLLESRSRIVATADAERCRLERDLHDGTQQHLVLLRLKLDRTVDDDERRKLAVELREDLERALAELRELAHGIYPSILENEGLPGALREAVERAAIPASLEPDGVARYPAEVEAAVCSCCLEALRNAA
jgi:signal transduction histidine kinase